MKLALRSLLASGLLLVGPALTGGAMLGAQASDESQDTTARPSGHFHIGLTVHDYGISFGNAARVHGIRINVQDAALERVNGVNLTFWKPREPISGTINGLQLGLLPGSQYVNGVAIGIGGVVAERRARWITIGGLGAVSNDRIDGIAIGGLGTVANGDVAGIAIAGLGTVSNRNLTGIAIAGLGTVVNSDLTGFAFGG